MAPKGFTIFFVLIFICIPAISKCDDKRNYEQLILTPLIEAGKIKEAQDAAKVTEIPEMQGTTSYSGYFSVNKAAQTNLFFWYFPALTNYTDAPILIWLEGGHTRRSSLRGLFLENGPFELEGQDLKKRNESLTDKHSVIYLDLLQYIGFSTTIISEELLTEGAIAENLYVAIVQFFQLFPELQKNELFIVGQSFAGKYAVLAADLIHQRNPNANLKINLGGVAIGNGLIDPETQLQYSEFLYYVGLVNAKGKFALQEIEQSLLTNLEHSKYQDAHEDFKRLIYYPFDVSPSQINTLYRQLTGFDNVVNYLYSELPATEDINLVKYLSQPSVRKAIHVGNTTFSSDGDFIEYHLTNDVMKGVVLYLPELINNYKVLVYSGQMDVLLPYVNTVNYLRKLDFIGSENFEDATRIQWFVEDTLAGYVTHIGNLTEVMVRRAGHRVTEEQLEWALDMFYSFTRGVEFSTLL